MGQFVEARMRGRSAPSIESANRFISEARVAAEGAGVVGYGSDVG